MKKALRCRSMQVISSCCYVRTCGAVNRSITVKTKRWQRPRPQSSLKAMHLTLMTSQISMAQILGENIGVYKSAESLRFFDVERLKRGLPGREQVDAELL